jgi:hypothetical protein
MKCHAVRCRFDNGGFDCQSAQNCECEENADLLLRFFFFFFWESEISFALQWQLVAG